MDDLECDGDIVSPFCNAERAIRDRDLERLGQLIEEHPALLHEVEDGSLNWTLLHHAASEGFLDAIRLLVERGVDVNARVESLAGDTPLDVAINRHRFEVGLLLLDRGANPNIPTWMWITALVRALDDLEQVPATLKEPFVTRCIEAAGRFAAPEYLDGTKPEFWPRNPGGPRPRRV
ncbi:MAG: ankyrin repeat domain-containing protein [Phycisphaerales bacterium JB064]